MKFKYIIFLILITIPLLVSTAYAFSAPSIKLTAPVSYNGILGSKNNPYLINSTSDYNSLINTYKDNSNVYLKLNTDITETQTTPLARFEFNGNLDGNNKTITFLNTSLYTSIGGTISNLNFVLESQSSFEATSGMLCNDLKGKLINCTNNSTLNANLSSSTTALGGFAGTNSENAEIINCTNNANINISTLFGIRVGGFLGQTDNTLSIKNCVNNGNITINSTGTQASSVSIYAGGFVGYASFKATSSNSDTYHFEKLKNSGAITLTAKSTSTYCRAGGICGGITNNTITTIDQCLSEGAISATNATSNSNYGNQLGGILGYVHGNSNNFAKITLSNSYATCSINSTTTSKSTSIIGGLIGYTYTKNTDNMCVDVNILNCYSTATISTTEQTSDTIIHVGGLIGKSAKTIITNTFSNALINSYSNSTKYLGGLVGSYFNNISPAVQISVSNSISNTDFNYNLSSIKYVAGFVGYLEGNSSNIDSQILNSTYKTSNLESSFSSSCCSLAIGNTTSSLTSCGFENANETIKNKNSSFYQNWDFENIWTFNELPVIEF